MQLSGVLLVICTLLSFLQVSHFQNIPKSLKLQWFRDQEKLLQHEISLCIGKGGKVGATLRLRRNIDVDLKLAAQSVAFYRTKLLNCLKSLGITGTGTGTGTGNVVTLPQTAPTQKPVQNSQKPNPKTPKPTQKPACPQDWIEWRDGCYKFDKDNARSWANARKFCQGLHTGSDLVSIENEAENKFLLSQLENEKDDGYVYWIGLTDKQSDGQFKWAATGQAVSYTNWAKGYHNKGKDGYDCGFFEYLDGAWYWDDYNCANQEYAICELRLRSTGATGGGSGGDGGSGGTGNTGSVQQMQCPKDWVKYQQSCYKILTDNPLNWDQSQKQCNSLKTKANLVSIESKEEDEFVISKLKEINGEGLVFWIGGNDKQSDGQFKWAATGQGMTYTNWASKYHNKGADGRDCVFYELLDGKWKWDDYQCDNQEYAICELVLGPSSSTGTTTSGTGNSGTGTTASGTAISTQAPTTPKPCPDGFILWKRSCYKLDANKAFTWDDAQKHCQGLNAKANLVSVETEEEDKFLISKLDELKGDGYVFWIGGKASNGQFKWTKTGQAFAYKNWADKYFNQGKDSKECVFYEKIDNTWKWDDYKCDNKEYALCEIELY